MRTLTFKDFANDHVLMADTRGTPPPWRCYKAARRTDPRAAAAFIRLRLSIPTMDLAILEFSFFFAGGWAATMLPPDGCYKVGCPTCVHEGPDGDPKLLVQVPDDATVTCVEGEE